MRGNVTTSHNVYALDVDASLNTTGFIGGLQGGYDLVSRDGWLIGIEADFDGSTTDTRLHTTTPVNTTVEADVLARSSLSFVGTARLRGGYILPGNVLIFGAAGFAYGGVGINQEATARTPAETVQTTVNRFSVRTGWTVGTGVEIPVGEGLTLRSEYLYVDLGDHRMIRTVFDTAMVSGNADFKASAQAHVVRVALNYALD
jgi:outer membrane immunogenic protein